jgi:DNA-binding transcriptional MerR regulator
VGEGALEKAPDAFRTISEVAEEINVPQHVLRFWESRFTQIRPLKRGGGRRYYRPDDIDLLRGVRHLLYGEGYTIRGVQRILREEGLAFVQSVWRDAERPAAAPEVEDDAEAVSADELESEEEAQAEAEEEDDGEEEGGEEEGDEEEEGEEEDDEEEEGEDEAESGAARRPREPSFFPGPSPTAVRADERRQPALAPSAAGSAPARASTDSQGRKKLQAALDELVECRVLMEAALADAALPQEQPDEAS